MTVGPSRHQMKFGYQLLDGDDIVYVIPGAHNSGQLLFSSTKISIHNSPLRN